MALCERYEIRMNIGKPEEEEKLAKIEKGKH